MITTRYRIGETWYKEIVGRPYSKLLMFKKKYEEAGFKTWINNFDGYQWMLTIEEIVR